MLAQIGSVPINDIGTDISVPIEMLVTKIAFLCLRQYKFLPFVRSLR